MGRHGKELLSRDRCGWARMCSCRMPPAPMRSMVVHVPVVSHTLSLLQCVAVSPRPCACVLLMHEIHDKANGRCELARSKDDSFRPVPRQTPSIRGEFAVLASGVFGALSVDARRPVHGGHAAAVALLQPRLGVAGADCVIARLAFAGGESGRSACPCLGLGERRALPSAWRAS